MTTLKRIKLATWLIQKLGISPYALFYHQLGIFKYQNMEISGEMFFIEKVLAILLKNIEKPVFFDVGANQGDYSKELLVYFPNAEVHCFEPSSRAFEKLAQNKKIIAINKGLSDKMEKLEFYQDNNTEEQTLSSFYPQFIEQYTKSYDKIDIEVSTLNFYCKQNSISNISFLKIDTEGHEYKVLLGASEMLQNVDIIQFEFNKSHIYSHVLLKNFYDYLPNFHFFRLDTSNLIDINKYQSKNEIFAFQNIIAVSHKLTRSDLWKKNTDQWVKKI